jgi:UDP-glucose 4-epimerase
LAILVTGAAGFIGSYFLSKALREGEDVVAYDINPPNPRLVGSVDGLTVVRGNVLDLRGISRTIEDYGIKEVVHLASLLTSPSQKDPMKAIDVNIKGTLSVLEASRLFGIDRIVFASSQAVYGHTSEQPIDEEHPKNPCTIYGISKLASELLGMNYNELYGMSFIALRFPLVYGMGKARGFNIIEQLIESGSATVRGDQKYEPLYVKDAAKALFLALRARGIKHHIFNIGSGQMLSLWEMVEIIKKFVPTASIKIEAGRDPSYCTRGPLNCERARRELSFEPMYDFEKGVEDYFIMLNRKPN